MSYKKYLDGFKFNTKEKVGTFKETVVNSKEFVNVFLDLTEGKDYERKNSLFDSLMTSIECTLHNCHTRICIKIESDQYFSCGK